MCKGDATPPLSPRLSVPGAGRSGENILRIPKNKSTGNLLPSKNDASPGSQKKRFSFDAGTAQEMNNLKRCVCAYLRPLWTGHVDARPGLLEWTMNLAWEDRDFEEFDGWVLHFGHLPLWWKRESS